MTLALVWVGIYIVQGGNWQGLCYSTQQVGGAGGSMAI
jgi:hypothetical protein